MRVLHAPTLMQWGCAHHWKTTTTRPGYGDVVRMRYLTCRRCGLKVKTEERLAVPWDEGDFLAQVKALLPEGQAVALREAGITAPALATLNARLAPQGYVIRATNGREPTRRTACTGEDGQVQRYGVFALRPLPPKGASRTHRTARGQAPHPRPSRHRVEQKERKR
jgi:hypothetical protein